jgi:hypothetical protein
MSLAGKQNTSQYHRIQASVSRQAAVCCGSAEKELRQGHLDAAKRHEEMARHFAKVEGLLKAADVEAQAIARMCLITDPVAIAALKNAYLAGRAAELRSH